MNTGREIETKRLKLLPGSNKRDSKPFLKMLREDGNFREFCGVEFSEKNLSEFATILNVPDMKNVFILFSKKILLKNLSAM